MACVDNICFKDVVFETDSKVLLIQAPQSWQRLQSFTSDFLGSVRRHLKARFSFRGRGANHYADCIAKKDSNLSIYTKCMLRNVVCPNIYLVCLKGKNGLIPKLMV